jgi:hypothetical protein
MNRLTTRRHVRAVLDGLRATFGRAGGSQGSTLLEVLVSVILLGGALAGMDAVYAQVVATPTVVAEALVATHEAMSGLEASQQVEAENGWQRDWWHGWWQTWWQGGHLRSQDLVALPSSLGGMDLLGQFTTGGPACVDLGDQCAIVGWTAPNGRRLHVELVAPAPPNWSGHSGD